MFAVFSFFFSETTDRVTRKKKANPQFVKSNSMVVCVLQVGGGREEVVAFIYLLFILFGIFCF